MSRANGAMEVVQQSAMMAATPEWTRERVDLLKRTVCPQGIGDDEFRLFLEQCKRSGLDPLLKEAFCVPRKAKTANGSWVTKHEFQPSEAGMLARAESFPDFRGISAAAVYSEDDITIDAGMGEVSHKFSPGKKRGSLVGAWALLRRQGREPIVAWLDIGGYRQSSPLWNNIPSTMIEKCARVAVLRKAYPSAFGGLYVSEEMPPPETESLPRASAPPPAMAASRSDEPVDAEVVDEPPHPADAEPQGEPGAPSPEEQALIAIDEAQSRADLPDVTKKIIALGQAKNPKVRDAYGRKDRALGGGQ